MRINGVGDTNVKASVETGALPAEQTANIPRVSSRCDPCYEWRHRRKLLLGSAILITLFIITVALVTAQSLGAFDDDYSYWDSESQELGGIQMLATGELAIIPRASWSYHPPAELPLLGHPTPYVVIKHTAGPECAGLPQCGNYLRNVRELHWQLFQQPEISYNFLIDSVGNVYEGRGWYSTNVNKGAVYRCNVDIALIGNFAEHEVPEAMGRALQQLLDHGVNGGLISTDYRLLAHNQVSNTVSPGHLALEAIKGWPHRCLSHCYEGIQCPTP